MLKRLKIFNNNTISVISNTVFLFKIKNSNLLSSYVWFRIIGALVKKRFVLSLGKKRKILTMHQPFIGFSLRFKSVLFKSAKFRSKLEKKKRAKDLKNKQKKVKRVKKNP